MQTAKLTMSAAASPQCAIQPAPSQTPCINATAWVVGSKFASIRIAAGSLATGKNNPETATIG